MRWAALTARVRNRTFPRARSRSLSANGSWARPLRVLLVIHGYPPRFSAGSEVYTQSLALGLSAAGHSVQVFCRELDEFRPDFEVREERDAIDPSICVHVVNHARENARFAHHLMDEALARVLRAARPDVVHFGHLSHLSTGLVGVASGQGLPVVFTLHDYWLACPRGQFIQHALTDPAAGVLEPYPLCSGQEDRKCATTCMARYHTGVTPAADERYWTAWVAARMDAARAVRDMVDAFIAPSRRLMQRMVNEFGLPMSKTTYLDYGFDLERLAGRRARWRARDRPGEAPFVFGYVGRLHPSKGLDLLLRALATLLRKQGPGAAVLRVFGHDTGMAASIARLGADLGLPSGCVELCGGFDNASVVKAVFDRVDAVAVPSVWDENSPLVIHEAQEAGVPVVTANHGGMGEYVREGVNGFTFAHRDAASLAEALGRAAADVPGGRRPHPHYLHSADGHVPGLDEHCSDVTAIYERLLSSRK